MKRQVRKWARTPATDDLLHERCVAVLNQFRLPQRDPFPVPEWSLDHPVVPEAFAELLGASTTPDAPTTITSEPVGEPPAIEPRGVTMKGTGSRKTKPFDLATGDYEVTMELTRACDGADTAFAVLERVDGEGVSGGFIEQSDYVYGIESGRHYWDVDTAFTKCGWTFTRTPLEG